MKTKIMPTAVLGIICLISALLLALINIPTEAKIESDRKTLEAETLREVLPAGEIFDDPMDLEGLGLPREVKSVNKESNGKGYVFKLEVKGYDTGLVIMCGIDADGKIAGVKHTQSNETYGLEPELNAAYVGASQSDITKIIATGATQNSATSNGYYTAMTAALSAYEILSAKEGN